MSLFYSSFHQQGDNMKEKLCDVLIVILVIAAFTLISEPEYLEQINQKATSVACDRGADCE